MKSVMKQLSIFALVFNALASELPNGLKPKPCIGIIAIKRKVSESSKSNENSNESEVSEQSSAEESKEEASEDKSGLDQPLSSDDPKLLEQAGEEKDDSISLEKELNPAEQSSDSGDAEKDESLKSEQAAESKETKEQEYDDVPKN